MSPDDEEQQSSQDSGEDQRTSSEPPELSEEGKEEVRKMQDAYDDSRKTAVLPGTDRTITGTAVNEWLDDEGNPKFGKDKPQEDKREEDKPQDAPENG